MNDWLDPPEWFAALPTMYGTAAAVFFSPSGEVLIVKPNYRPHWSLPGGILEDGEPPRAGCAREVREELGLDITPGPALCVNWIAPEGDRPRPLVAFVYDGGVLPADPPIVLQESELDAWRFVAAGSLGEFLPPHMADRVLAAIRARDNGAGTIYLESWPEG
jgi:8-oxo-dGTP diphosphatase